MTLTNEAPTTSSVSGFTMPEYRQVVRQYQHVLEQYWKQTRQAPGGLERRDMLEEMLTSLGRKYRTRLPVYLLARCPFCGGVVREAIDTYSLNGLVTHGWCGTGPDGLGWWGNGSYQAECEHVRIVAYCISLGDLVPDDVFYDVSLGPEVPYVMQEPLRAPDSTVVLRALPVGRFDDDQPQHRYTAYFMSYFVVSEEALWEALREWQDYGMVRYDEHLDFDLRPYIERGQLYWLDPDDPDLPLRNQPVGACPYLDLPGSRNPWRKIPGDALSYTLRRVRGWWQRLKW
jgi:hypothetical protein